jgi:hypothetical protein
METEQHTADRLVGCWRNKGRNQKFWESNENGNTTNHNLWDIAKAVLRGKFVAISAYVTKTREFSNNLILYLKLLEKQEQTKPWTSSQREIIKESGPRTMRSFSLFKESMKYKVRLERLTRSINS